MVNKYGYNDYKKAKVYSKFPPSKKKKSHAENSELICI